MNQKFLISHTTDLPFDTRIQGQDARHICKVLRLKPDDEISLSDGNGIDYTGRILSVSPSDTVVRVEQAARSGTESRLNMTLGCAMLKDKKMDLVIKHATQLGISKWIPFYSTRSIPQPSKKRMTARHQRWETIARESLKQCRRSRVVDIAMPVSFQALIDAASSHDIRITFWENESRPLKQLKRDPQVSSAIILIGPEGGFTPEEIETVQAAGFVSYSLGPRILRAETAAISACTLIQHILGDI